MFYEVTEEERPELFFAMVIMIKGQGLPLVRFFLFTVLRFYGFTVFPFTSRTTYNKHKPKPCKTYVL